MQAAVKLTTSLGENIREMSNVWGPPIYRRLVSNDKKERDMSERCLQKIKSVICPPPGSLTKSLVLDMKKRLLPALKELLHNGMKIQTLQAWGWYIRLLGAHALKSKHIVNEMLTVPQQTFSDSDPQVQVASLVAWEGLIDSLLHLPIPASETIAKEHSFQQMRSCEGNSSIPADGHSKRIKLIMKPLVGILSSRCDVSVRASCLNTWSYLLHKLDASVSCASLINIVWEPIFEVIFQAGPDDKTIILWTFCVDMLDTFILVRYNDVNEKLNKLEGGQVSAKIPTVEFVGSSKLSWKKYPIKRSAWSLNHLDFFNRMIHYVISPRSRITGELRDIACDAALRLFRSVLKSVQSVLNCNHIPYEEVMFCLSTTLRFLKSISEDATLENGDPLCSQYISLQFLEAAIQELKPSILESPLYKVAFDLKFVQKQDENSEFGGASYPGMVSPVVYLSSLYFFTVVKLMSKASELESISQRMYSCLTFLTSVYDPLQIFQAYSCLLYKMEYNYLNMWVTIAECVHYHINDKKDLSLVKVDLDSQLSVALKLLSYPFATWDCLQLEPDQSKVSEAWRLLFTSANQVSQLEYGPQQSLSEDLCSIVNRYVDKIMSKVQSGNETHLQNINQISFLSFCGDAVICVLEQLTCDVHLTVDQHKDDQNKGFGTFKDSVAFTARFMNLSWTMKSINTPVSFALTTRVFSSLVGFVGRLNVMEDIVCFTEIVSGPLVLWLTSTEVPDKDINYQLQLLWSEILTCLQKCTPSIKFDTPFLKFQEPLLMKTFDHPNPAIVERTVQFWNSTYGENTNLDYPQDLLPVLDKLSRKGTIRISNKRPSFDERNYIEVGNMNAPQRFKMTAILNRCSKRVELKDVEANGLVDNSKLHTSSKRKRCVLTEHQKEVRRAQQGRDRDCGGHGPGIRTYTNADFSQTNEESQDSQEIRDADSILEMLRKVC